GGWISSGGQQIPQSSVERALIHPDGTIDTFETKTDSAMQMPRMLVNGVVLGNYYYILGGMDASLAALSSTERATIQPDGTLGAFSPSLSLGSTRARASVAILGDWVYIFGGSGGGMPNPSIQRTEIPPNGAIGSLQSATGTLASN